MGKVLKFPTQQSLVGYKIPLYTHNEILVVLTALTLYARMYGYYAQITLTSLKKIDPEIVIRCLTAALAAGMFSKDANDTMRKILSSIEEVRVAK